MKKLTIILFLFAFNVNAQFQLSEDWSFKTDKQYHAIAGVAISTGTYMLVYKNTKDAEWARHVAIFVGITAGFGKEFLDGMGGAEISLSDLTYTSVSVIATSWLIYGGHKLIQKHRQKKIEKQFQTYNKIHYSLDNEIFNTNIN